jgi:hypothetical protein
MQRGRTAAKMEFPGPPCFSNFNTEGTEDLSDLCVESFSGTEDTEKRPGVTRRGCKSPLRGGA